MRNAANEAHSVDITQTFMTVADWGAAWVMWLMLGLAFILAVLVFERAVLFTRTRVDVVELGRRLSEVLEANDVERAKDLVKRGLAMEERVLADGLEAWSRGRIVVERVMKGSLERERQRFDRFLDYMGTLGANVPFVGLLGTVIGIVIAFKQLAANPKGGMAVVGPGIAEALASTAVGLAVAIPAVIAFNTLKKKLACRVGNVEFLSGILLSQLDSQEGGQSWR
jgi:biopolymer transport protein ExbB